MKNLKLPNGWTYYNLGTIAEVTSGITKDSKRVGPGMREVPYLRVANVQRGYLKLDEVKTIFVKQSELDSLRLEYGDILLNEGGDRDKLGRGWIWENQIPECIHQNHVFRARILRSDILPKFVSYYTNSEEARTYFQESGKQTTNLASINSTKLKELLIPLPSLAEQHRIVATIEAHFSRLDSAVASLERAKANLKRARASVLKAAVEGRLVPTEAALAREEGREYEPASVLLEKILEERRAKWAESGGRGKYKEPVAPETEGLPDLPEGWCWSHLDQIGELERGKSKHRPRNDPRLLGGIYPFIQTGDVRNSNGVINRYTTTYSEFGLSQSKLWPSGTLCITIAANIAETAILCIEACFPDSIVGFIGWGSSISVRYIELFFRTEKNHLEKFAPATAQKNINLQTLHGLAIRLPPLAEQNRIVMEVDRQLSVLYKLDDTLDANLDRCTQLRQVILKRAFEGKLVPPEKLEEPQKRSEKQLKIPFQKGC